MAGSCDVKAENPSARVKLLLREAAPARANAWRWVCRLVRGRRIFLRDICFAIFYPRGHE
jgi:hypothetical protein